MRGRKPKPARLNALHGNPGRRAPRIVPIVSAITMAEPPAYLSPDGKALWTTLVAELRAARVLSRLDLELLAAYCAAWGDYLKAERQIAKSGAVVRGRDGARVRSPWVVIRRQALDQLTRIASEFGLTPASRVRLGQPLGPRAPESAEPQRHARAPLRQFIAQRPTSRRLNS